MQRAAGLGLTSTGKLRAAPVISFNTTSIAFGGTNEVLTRADAAAHDFTTAMSYSFWVKAPATAATAGIISKGDYTLNTIAYYCCRPSTHPSKLAVVLGNTGVGQHDKNYRTSLTVFDDTWKHVAVTFEANVLKIYVNAVEDTNPTKSTDNSITTLFNSAIGLRVGSLFESGAGISFLVGNLCSLSLWSVALSAAEVTALYNGGKTTDVSLHSQYANCVSWYKLGDGDHMTNANGIVDTKGALHLTASNMENPGDIVSDVP